MEIEKYLNGFRPLAGDLSSLQTITVKEVETVETVSVPLQGTYLPYTSVIDGQHKAA